MISREIEGIHGPNRGDPGSCKPGEQPRLFFEFTSFGGAEE
jgi:hypothetical protein